MNNFPKNLRYLRKKKGLLQDEMQSRLGIARSTWSNYENGKTNPTVDDLVRFSIFFGITLDELILHDLSAADSPVTKNNKPRSPVQYSPNDVTTTANEPALAYVLQELKKLKEDVILIKGKKKKP